MTALTVLGVLLAHLAGDYLLQSDWMAAEKTKRWWPAWAHALTYGLPYVTVTRSVPALAVIVVLPDAENPHEAGVHDADVVR
ncbi:DUF3307 domain-containing protein [Kitasatospora sp. NPDC004272]